MEYPSIIGLSKMLKKKQKDLYTSILIFKFKQTISKQYTLLLSLLYCTDSQNN